MPIAQQEKKGTKFYWSHTAQIKEVLLYVIIKSLRVFVVDCFTLVGAHQHDVIKQDTR